ncbi:LysM peptidoglycan-binding domain-containing protein [Sulfurovum sp.]|uniref:C40 family peptidase n=1 Tax=Sulfurovum sp. TaxID=1969726 RepID=UPI0028680725|nr:LysM peptidoglycan-binding domain-containing protein [Sulfurovum sp.]
MIDTISMTFAQGALLKKLYTLLLTLSLSTVAAHAVTKTLNHKIKSGDSLSQIAQKNNTTIAQIRQANSMKEGETLKLGRVLKIPTKTYASNQTTSNQTTSIPVKYQIKKGDSLSQIAQKNNTTIAQIRQANSMKEGETLKLGRVLKIPTKTYASSKTSSSKTSSSLAKYKIKNGDSLSQIAQKNNTTVAEIKKANEMTGSQTLKLGRILKVPQNNTVKSTIAEAPQNKQKIKLSQAKEAASNKKLAASIAKLATITLDKNKVKKSNKRSIGDILFGEGKDKSVKLAEAEKSLEAEKCVRITSLAKKKLGNKYVWGATGGRNTFDCSGLTTYVYKQNGIKLPRRAIAQSKTGKRVKRENLQKGDLVFFDTSKSRKGYVNHVGIYIGDNKFIHASSAKKKVIVTSLNAPFYSKRFTGARRLES